MTPASLPPSSPPLQFSCCRSGSGGGREWPEAITATISATSSPSSLLHLLFTRMLHQGLIFHQQSMKSREECHAQQASSYEGRGWGGGALSRVRPAGSPTRVTSAHAQLRGAETRAACSRTRPNFEWKWWNQVDAKLKWQSELCWFDDKQGFLVLLCLPGVTGTSWRDIQGWNKSTWAAWPLCYHG